VCEICGQPGTDIHHIIRRARWTDGFMVAGNVLFVCKECHIGLHSHKIDESPYKETANKAYREWIEAGRPRDEIARHLKRKRRSAAKEREREMKNKSRRKWYAAHKDEINAARREKYRKTRKKSCEKT